MSYSKVIEIALCVVGICLSLGVLVYHAITPND